jgi:Heterokaryon incompatibility protein (HET)
VYDLESPSSLKKYISGRAICLPDSDLNIGKIQKWLKDCLESHGRCRNGLSSALLDNRKGGSILPSRVVAVGLESSSQVRLVTTNGERGRYCALSYCWGPKSPRYSHTTLLTTTIDQFRQSLPVNELPNTIKEAIEVTRRIGVPYLWVDRLCIVQDDAKDVGTECDRMCDIYERALLILAAMGDDIGCYG